MSSMECVNESDAVLSESDPSAKLRSRVYVGFAGTVALGLSLAGWYVGGRILAAEQSSSVPSPLVTSKEIVTPMPEIKPVQAIPAEVPPAPAQEATKPAPQLFLEVAGLGTKQDALFIKKLRAKGLSARVDAASKEEDDRRILIGPFSEPQAIQKAQRKLQAQGILALERSY